MFVPDALASRSLAIFLAGWSQERAVVVTGKWVMMMKGWCFWRFITIGVALVLR